MIAAFATAASTPATFVEWSLTRIEATQDRALRKRIASIYFQPAVGRTSQTQSPLRRRCSRDVPFMWARLRAWNARRELRPGAGLGYLDFARHSSQTLVGPVAGMTLVIEGCYRSRRTGAITHSGTCHNITAAMSIANWRPDNRMSHDSFGRSSWYARSPVLAPCHSHAGFDANSCQPQPEERLRCRDQRQARPPRRLASVNAVHPARRDLHSPFERSPTSQSNKCHDLITPLFSLLDSYAPIDFSHTLRQVPKVRDHDRELGHNEKPQQWERLDLTAAAHNFHDRSAGYGQEDSVASSVHYSYRCCGGWSRCSAWPGQYAGPCGWWTVWLAGRCGVVCHKS